MKKQQPNSILRKKFLDNNPKKRKNIVCYIMYLGLLIRLLGFCFPILWFNPKLMHNSPALGAYSINYAVYLTVKT
jgi:hypothetical protein